MPQIHLFGEYELSIDPKHRLTIPSEIKKLLRPDVEGNAFFVIVGPNRKPWLYPEHYWIELAAQLQQQIAPDDDLLEFQQMYFARARRIEWDTAGRVLLPEKALIRTNTGKDVTLIGAHDHLEIWNRQEWDAREEDLFNRMPEIMRRSRQPKTQAP